MTQSFSPKIAEGARAFRALKLVQLRALVRGRWTQRVNPVSWPKAEVTCSFGKDSVDFHIKTGDERGHVATVSIPIKEMREFLVADKHHRDMVDAEFQSEMRPERQKKQARAAQPPA